MQYFVPCCHRLTSTLKLPWLRDIILSFVPRYMLCTLGLWSFIRHILGRFALRLRLRPQIKPCTDFHTISSGFAFDTRALFTLAHESHHARLSHEQKFHKSWQVCSSPLIFHLIYRIRLPAKMLHFQLVVREQHHKPRTGP